MIGISFVLASSAIALLSLGLYGWLFTRGPSALSFASFIILCAAMAALYAMEIYSTSFPQKIVAARLLLAPSALIPLAWFFVAVRRTETPFRISSRFVILVSIVPAITVLLSLTGIHPEWIRFNYQMPATAAGQGVLGFQNGPWFLVHLFYCYGLGIASLMVMTATLRSPQTTHRPQTIILIISNIIPGLIDLLFQMGIRPGSGISFYPVALPVSGVLAASALYGTRFFALLPVARSLVFTSLDEAVLVLDSESRICDCNPAGRRLFGGAAGAATEIRRLGSPWAEVLEPLARSSTRQSHREVALADGVFEIDVSLVVDVAGRLRGRCIVVRDVTTRAEMEKKLRDSEEKLRAFFEQATEAFSLTDEQGRIVEFNPAAEKLTGVARADAVGRFAWDLQALLLPEAAVDRTHNVAQGLLEDALKSGGGGGTFHLFKGKVRAADGEEKFFEQIFFPIRTNRGYCLGTSALDVSERTRSEEALRRTEERLLQAQKMEAVGKLAGGIAHDFNNHLTVIGGYVEAVLENMPDGPAREGIQEIQGAAERGASLTRQLLAFSRKQVLAPRAIVLTDVLSSSLNMIRRLIGENVAIETRLEGVTSRILADPTQIEQIIVNLAINARDAMPRGGTLFIETARVLPTASGRALPPELSTVPCVMLEVRDTGVGMDRETLSHLFEPFFTTKEPGRGTGLGMSIVYGFVRQNGGHIFCDSVPNKGTTITICFPEIHGVHEPARQKTEAAAPRADGHETVLLVEDDGAVRKLIRRLLQKNGYVVVEAESGAAALATPVTTACGFQLLITDVVMPEMNGADLARILIERCPTAKVMYLSGYMEDEMLRNGVATGDAGFLQKPFTAELFLRKVYDILHS